MTSGRSAPVGLAHPRPTSALRDVTHGTPVPCLGVLKTPLFGMNDTLALQGLHNFLGSLTKRGWTQVHNSSAGVKGSTEDCPSPIIESYDRSLRFRVPLDQATAYSTKYGPRGQIPRQTETGSLSFGSNTGFDPLFEAQLEHISDDQ